jgi:hypothetical protein
VVPCPIETSAPDVGAGSPANVTLTQQQEFVIGGYTPPEGMRKYFGALLVGYKGPEGLLFAGRVGTGFSEKALETSIRWPREDQAVNVPLREPAREGTRALASNHHVCGHETLCLG